MRRELRARASTGVFNCPPPPIILYECQKKGFTKFAFRKSLILKDAILTVWTSKWLPEKEKAGASSRTPNTLSYAVNYTKEEEKVKEKFREFLVTRPLRTRLYCREPWAR